MRIDIITLFPKSFSVFDESIISRARKNGLIDINIFDLRDYTKDKHKKVDDYNFSGGAGLLIRADVVYDAVSAIDPEHKAHRIFLTPSAPIFNQQKVQELAKFERILLLCGHYEGVDQRAIDLCFDEVVSIGKFVLTGGEIACMAVVDAVARYIDGVIAPESLKNESYANGDELEYPQFTRPREFMGLTVPEVLLSGNHAEIEKWKREQSAVMTQKVAMTGKGEEV
ncbi:MAG: tRNA (guanosine(37)-N1)-methyltransferase TrmD [Christensenellaceae bacterium]|jgi:tRNA (guanine37-N1)-methyltransferase|nr:tRNA (guanosine(37)-N1)-methyltransferase TrmD [Christensenellaceae bacterium]